MRTNLTVLLALAFAGCSSAPPASNPDGCPAISGTETISNLNAQVIASSCDTPAPFQGDTWVVSFDGHGHATLESTLYANAPALGSTGARPCTGTIVSNQGVRCSTISVDCPAALNKGFGLDLNVQADLVSSPSSSVHVGDGDPSTPSCGHVYSATATH